MSLDLFRRFDGLSRTFRITLLAGFLLAIRELRARLTGRVERAVGDRLLAGDIEGAVDLVLPVAIFTSALVPFREAIRNTIVRAAQVAFRDIPVPKLSTLVRAVKALRPFPQTQALSQSLSQALSQSVRLPSSTAAAQAILRALPATTAAAPPAPPIPGRRTPRTPFTPRSAPTIPPPPPSAPPAAPGGGGSGAPPPKKPTLEAKPKGTSTKAAETPIVKVRLDPLDERVITAVRTVEQKALTTLRADIRDTVKQHIEAGLRDGVNPREIARGLREVIGLAPNQELAVRNFRAALEAGDRTVFERALRDQRFDKTIMKAFARIEAGGKGLTPAQIDTMVAAYRKRFVAFHAETVSRTLAINAMKEGQALAWQQSIADGSVKEEDLVEEWNTRLDGRERKAHHDMHKKTKRFNELWMVEGVGPQRYPGESEYNCRCRTVVRIEPRKSLSVA